MIKIFFKNKITQVGLLATSFLLTASASAAEGDATLPPGVTEAFDVLLSQFTQIESLAWKVVIPVTLGFVVIGLVKRLIRKSAS